ncbi:hypothetical protein C380_03205 [Acidovorax sp. KKS102]|uniref:hypothetical protein n=1 Tax=Acidovorax sp. KKS102 TaxID=358220 RepID=UPI00028B3D25|nr:hypothetical protein [Acidovorax sp. KKS102]AFU44366.1 hypothetical protein C380_03205 [Acidovorax sp. KKS102]
MKQFERITTEYVEAEDRIRMAGTLHGGELVVAWFTQRLLQRLVAALVQQLQGQGAGVPRSDGPRADMLAPDALRAQVMQGFAQQAARAKLAPQPAVLAAPDHEAWLVHEVNVAQLPQAVQLTFKGMRTGSGVERTPIGVLVLAPEPLRQWLCILYDNYRKAGWPLQVWPDWVTESAVASVPAGTTLLH